MYKYIKRSESLIRIDSAHYMFTNIQARQFCIILLVLICCIAMEDQYNYKVFKKYVVSSSRKKSVDLPK